MTFTQKLLTKVSLGVAYMLSLLPRWVLYGLTDLMYLLTYHVLGYRKRVIADNLQRCFPQKSAQEQEQIARTFSRHLCSMFAEWVWYSCRPERDLQARVRYEGLEILQQHHRDGRAVLLVMGHYGNWEVLNTLTPHTPYDFYAVYKEQTNAVGNTLSLRMRTRFGAYVLESKEVYRFALKHRNDPKLYLFLADQAPLQGATEPFLFLGQPTAAFAGVERLAKGVGAAVVYLEIMPEEGRRGHYVVSLRDIPTEQPELVTRRFFAALEDSIQRKPAYWLWSHRRWKRPVRLPEQQDAL